MTTVTAIVPTTVGDGTHPVTDWSGVTASTIRLAYVWRIAQMSTADDMRGYCFVIDPATLQPQLARSTTYPAAP